MPRLEPHHVARFHSVEDLRAWLAANGETALELWVALPRKTGTFTPPITWPVLVDELLAVGWIDGVRMPDPPDGQAIRCTPRRPRSIWSDRNVGRVEALRAEGRMTPAGEAAFAKRRDDRTGVYSFDGDWAFDAEAEAALRANPDGWAWLERQPAGYRRSTAQWVMSAKQAETRARRLAKLLEGCAEGYRLPEITGKPRPG